MELYKIVERTNIWTTYMTLNVEADKRAFESNFEKKYDFDKIIKRLSKKNTRVHVRRRHELIEEPVEINSIDESDRLTSVQFWNLITRNRIFDRDERNMTSQNIRYTHQEAVNLIQYLDNNIIPTMLDAMSEQPFDDAAQTIEEKKNVITHIAMKGHTYFTNMCRNPSVVLFMCTNTYPTYTWIKNIR